MTRPLAGLLLALLLWGPAASARPRLFCLHCDCTGGRCLERDCTCARGLDHSRVDALLDHVGRVLRLAFGEEAALHRPVLGLAVRPAELPGSDGELMGFYRAGEVYVGDALDLPETVAVVAHEYAHAWQEQHHSRYQEISPPFAEGFAEWIAYHVTRRTGYPAQAALIRNNADPIYGAGVRTFLWLEERHGARVVLRCARTWLDFQGRQ